MKKSAPYAVIGFGVLIMGLIAWWFGFRSEAPPQEMQEPLAPIEVSEGLSIYTSGEYGFLVAYPEGAEVSESFTSTHLLPTWRVNAVSESTGTPILSITPYRTQSDTSYPRSYEAVVRLGMSTDPKDVATCGVAQAQQGETALPDREIGETTWKVFSFGDAAMMKYVKGTSYRMVRDKRCYALEAIAVGSTYREEPSAQDIPEDVLEEEFRKLDTIIESFRFVR